MAGRVTRSRRQLSQQSEEQTRARWTDGLTKIFADLLVDQIRRGNRLNNSFSKKSWKSICDGFCQKTGLKWDIEQLKNRYAVMRKQYAIVNSILGRKDFSFDESNGTILASNEAWTEHIKVHPDAETLRNNGCPLYKQLCVIFSGLFSNGIHELSTTNQEKDIPTADPGKDPLNVIKIENSSSESEEGDEMEENQDRSQVAADNANANRKRGRRGIDDAIAGAILHMAAASKLRTATINRINARYSIADCIKELDRIQGIEQDVYFAALDLFNKPTAREIFLSLTEDKRLIWLRAKCAAK